MEKMEAQHRQDVDGVGTADIMSRHDQAEAENGDCSTPEKCKDKNSTLVDVLKKKSAKPRKPTVTNSMWSQGEEVDKNDLKKTIELFRHVRHILNGLTQQTFKQLMSQFIGLSIDTEERLKGVIDLTFEKAISEPDRAVVYANMCRCIMGLKVPSTGRPGTTVNFRKLMLNRCQKEFEKEFMEDEEDVYDDDAFEKKQMELEAESSQPLTEEMKDSRNKARRRAVGNVKFIGEHFKFKMMTESIMLDCIVKLLKNHNEESLECLCWLLFTIGKDLDSLKARPHMDQYFNQIEKFIRERKTSSRIRCMLQDVLDLRRNNWVPIEYSQASNKVNQIHKEEHWEQMKLQQALIFQKKIRDTGDQIRGGRGRGRGGSQGWWRRPYTPGRGAPPQDEDWNTVPILRNKPIGCSRLSRITKNVEFTLGEDSVKSKRSEISSLELRNQLNRLIQDQADNQRIFDWIKTNLDERQTSNMFVRALMTCICQSAISGDKPYRVKLIVIEQRAKLLQKFLKDEQMELEALYALQALMVQMEQPPNLLHMFFDCLYGEDVIKNKAFYKWESSKDPEEQVGKGVALKSVRAFFTWLREEESSSDSC